MNTVREGLATVAVALALALLAAACGGGSDDGSPSSPAPSLSPRQQGIDAHAISGTPTFIVNGNKVVGNVPLSAITSYFK